jgi:putative serine protease PepD
MRLQNFLSALLGALVVAVLVAALALGGAFDDDDEQPATATTTTEPQPSNEEAPSAGGQVSRNATDVSDLYRRVRDGVVYVEVSAGQRQPSLGQPDQPQPDLPQPGQPEQPGQPQEPSGSGSGFIINREGQVLTNEHVVENATRVRVRAGEDERFRDARVLGTDPGSDLALLQVEDGAEQLRPLALGSSEDVEVGDPAIAIGSPFGLAGSLTTGVISALGRPITAPNNFTITGAIQTDAAINPGNSGGPLLDVQGRVIGINAQIATQSGSNSGVGFAIPVDTAKQVIPALERGERPRRPYLGVSTGTSNEGGALVAEVVQGGPAERGGVRQGDRILSVGGREVNASDDVAEAIVGRRPGDTVEVVVQRGDARETLRVRLGTQPRRAAQG